MQNVKMETADGSFYLKHLKYRQFCYLVCTTLAEYLILSITRANLPFWLHATRVEVRMKVHHTYKTAVKWDVSHLLWKQGFFVSVVGTFLASHVNFSITYYDKALTMGSNQVKYALKVNLHLCGVCTFQSQWVCRAMCGCHPQKAGIHSAQCRWSPPGPHMSTDDE